MSAVVVVDDPVDDPKLVCEQCRMELCSIEDGDLLATLNGMVADHAPDCPGDRPEGAR